MPALSDIVPAAGLGGVIVVLVGYLLKQMAADRTDYRDRIAAEQARTAAAESRLAEERARADAERARADAAEDRIDGEIGRRRVAEDASAVAASEMRGMSAYWARATAGGGPVGGPPPVPELGSWPDSQVPR